MKSLSTKLLAFTFIFALATGCASSVTDVQESADEAEIEQVTPPAPDQGFGGDDVDPIREEPERD